MQKPCLRLYFWAMPLLLLASLPASAKGQVTQDIDDLINFCVAEEVALSAVSFSEVWDEAILLMVLLAIWRSRKQISLVALLIDRDTMLWKKMAESSLLWIQAALFVVR